MTDILIKKASTEDQDAILKIMEHWNMHHIPSPEMEELDISCFFIARIDDKIVGASGYKILSQTKGKTTLLGVIPEYNGKGIGGKLQDARLKAMFDVGVKTVITNADRPETIKWYKKHYGYKEIGKLKKLHSFGDNTYDSWTTLEMDLEGYMKTKEIKDFQKKYIAKNEPHPLAPYPPLLINVCLTGMIPTKDKTEFVPVTPEEITEDAIKVCDAGAQLIHIHARDVDGKPTWKGEIYEDIITRIRKERPKLICCISTSGRNWPEFEKRSEALLLKGMAKPDMASLTLGSLNFLTGPSINSMGMIEKLAVCMNENNIKPELEVFDSGMIGLSKYLEKKGILHGKKYYNILLGNVNTMSATIGNLASLVDSLPENSIWAGTGIGMFQLPINVASIIAGGGVRVGLEDNIHYDYKRKKLATNLELVERLIRIAGEVQRPLASIDEARSMIGLD